MNKYGYSLISPKEQIKNDLYDYFTSYFNNPSMTKVENTNNTSMYICRIMTLLNENRYLIVNVLETDHKVGHKTDMVNLKWLSLQTRMLNSIYDIPKHRYTPMKYPPLYKDIIRTQKQNDYSTYNCAVYPIEVTLLNIKKSYHDFPNRGTILSALETYSTIITFT